MSTTRIHSKLAQHMADLTHAPGECAFATVGSSEAIMLAILAMKRRWSEACKAAGMTEHVTPNLVCSSAVHVCHEKVQTQGICRAERGGGGTRRLASPARLRASTARAGRLTPPPLPLPPPTRPATISVRGVAVHGDLGMCLRCYGRTAARGCWRRPFQICTTSRGPPGPSFHPPCLAPPSSTLARPSTPLLFRDRNAHCQHLRGRAGHQPGASGRARGCQHHRCRRHPGHDLHRQGEGERERVKRSGRWAWCVHVHPGTPAQPTNHIFPQMHQVRSRMWLDWMPS